MPTVLLASGLIVLVGGCTTHAPTSTSDAAGLDFVAQANAAIDEATAGGATQDQLVILWRIASEGTVSASDYTEAVSSTFSCFTDAGIGYEVLGAPSDESTVQVGYAYESSPDTDPIAEACITGHSFWVEMLYQTSPERIAAGYAHLEARLPALLECLSEGGYDLPSDSTVDEVMQQLRSAARDEELGMTPPGWSATDCFDIATQ